MDFLRLVGEVRDKLVVRTAKDDDRRGLASSPPCSAVAASQNASNALDRVPWFAATAPNARFIPESPPPPANVGTGCA